MHSHSCCCLVHQLSSWAAGMHHEVSVVALVPRTAAGIMDNFFRCCRWDERLKCNFSGGFLMFQAKMRFGFAYNLKEFPNHLVALIKWLWQRKRREADRNVEAELQCMTSDRRRLHESLTQRKDNNFVSQLLRTSWSRISWVLSLCFSTILRELTDCCCCCVRAMESLWTYQRNRVMVPEAVGSRVK
jgi:hypothetical protein